MTKASNKDNLLITMSDVHIGHLTPVQTSTEFFGESGFFDQLDEIIEHTKENDLKFSGVAITGDLFDEKISMHSEYAKIAFDFMYRLVLKVIIENNGAIILIRGTYTHDYSQLDTFKSYSEQFPENFVIINSVAELELDGMNILCIPEEYMKNQTEYYADYFSKKYDVCLGHGLD